MNADASLHAVIARCHRELERLFFVHQQAMLIGALPRAVETLRAFTTAHDLHKHFEDEYLLPRLAELDDPGDWPVKIYHHEHDKIEAMLVRLDESVAALGTKAPTGAALHVALIDLLDHEKSVKGLCEHHQEREEKGMLPALDRQTDAAWRRAIIGPFVTAWDAALPPIADT